MSVACLKGLAISEERGGEGRAKKGRMGWRRWYGRFFFALPSLTGIEIAGGKQARNKREEVVVRRVSFAVSIYITRLFHFAREWSRNPVCKSAKGVVRSQECLNTRIFDRDCPLPTNRHRYKARIVIEKFNDRHESCPVHRCTEI